MAIKEFEYYHGAVLTKLLRKDIPMTLTLIETDKNQSWSAYKISSNKNDYIFYVKYCLSPQVTKKHVRWTFRFTNEHLNELKKFLSNNLWLVLVCAQKDCKTKPMELCLLNKKEILEGIDIDSINQQTFTVYSESRKELKVCGTMNEKKFTVERDRIKCIV